jgi:tetratricopeptide (TPR) repeat protein
MSFLSRMFGGREERPEGWLTQRLERLEAEAESAAPAYVGSVYNRAGDLALRADDLERAVSYYGRAVDAFLEDGQREAARGVANKIFRVRPGSVRTLCTLTWLDLASRHTATALLHLRDYVAAAKDVDEYALAANQIFAMARIVPDTEFLEAAADALDGLDFGHRAEEVREWASQEGSPDAVRDHEELAAACLSAAVRSNERQKAPGQVKDTKGGGKRTKQGST